MVEQHRVELRPGLGLSAPGAGVRSTLADTRSGRLSGIQKGSVIQWRGVPYAAAPTGARRFRPPEPPLSWDGVRDATTFGPAAPQPVSPWQGLVGGQPGPSEEDCLFLNVFAPAHDAGGLAVMVWIHGGAFIGGSGSARWYDGGRFAAGGTVVVVTLNYRLGVLGFLEVSDVAGEGFAGSGNCGLLDQLAALRWIQDNIAAFGGDPAQVTVFGESAGAMSIGLMLAMPAARGLFHRAILQSGAAASYRTGHQAQRVTGDVLAALGGSFEELLMAPVERILAAQAAITASSDAAGYLAFRPVVDGLVIPEPPDQAIAAGRGAEVAVLVGTNRDEMTLFLAFDPGLDELTDDELDHRAAALIGAERWARVGGRYRAASDGRHPAALMAAVATDLVFRVPALRLAEGMARAPLWMYRLDWPSPAAGGRLGATHGLDIPFVWNLMDLPAVELFTGGAPGRHRLATAMNAAWLAFATSGDPATPLLPDWPRYQAPSRATMIFDAECRLMDDPDGAIRGIWGQL
jgi:para-nitrobenzyl esterase